MNLLTIALKSIRQRAVSSSLTTLSVALGVMLMVTVIVINGIVQDVFSQKSIGYDLIIGPKGSDLQLVLSTVFRVQPPIENLPYKYFLEVQKDRRVEVAIPFAFGDNTQQGGFPIVGTIDEFFTNDYAPKRSFRIRGHRLTNPFDAIIGSRVARENGWDLGSEFKLVHGGNEEHVHDEKFKVCGVLDTTGTANDRTVFIHLEGFYQISGHEKPLFDAVKRWKEFNGEQATEAEIKKEADELAKKYGLEEEHDHGSHAGHHHHHHHGTPDEQKEVTSILLKMKSTQQAILFSSDLKKGFKAQAVNPIIPMTQLMNTFVGNVRKVLLALTAMIIVVSGVGIFVSIYNSMSDRKREIAVMRALGASRQTVFSIILLESILLCVGGGLLGLALGHGLVFAAAPYVEAEASLVMDPWKFETIELVLIPVLIGLASLVGFIPGMTAYRTDVARALAE